MKRRERIEWEHVCYRDSWLVGLDKPAGWAVHRSRVTRDERTCLSILRNLLDQRVQPLHRIDRKTSGLVLFSLDPETTRLGMAQFARREVEKCYLAIVRGWLMEEVRIDSPLKSATTGELNEAITLVRPVARIELPHAVGPFPTVRYSLVMVYPETGRMHQIRRHLRRINHPILGDAVYGDGRHNRFFKEHFQTRRMALHAWGTRMQHPQTGKSLEIIAPVHGDLETILLQLGGPLPEKIPWLGSAPE